MRAPELYTSLIPDGSLHRGELVTGLVAGGAVTALVAVRPALARYAGALVAVAVVLGLAVRSLSPLGPAVVACAAPAAVLEPRARRVIAMAAVGAVGLVAVDEVRAGWPLPVVLVSGGLVLGAAPRLAAQQRPEVWWPTVAAVAVAVWAAVPDTEGPVLIATAIAASWPVGRYLRHSSEAAQGGAVAALGMLAVWAAVLGAPGRPAAAIGALAWVVPWSVHARWGPRRPMVLGPFLVVTSGVVASRVAGDEASWSPALYLSAATIVPAAALLALLGRRDAQGTGTGRGPTDA